MKFNEKYIMGLGVLLAVGYFSWRSGVKPNFEPLPVYSQVKSIDFVDSQGKSFVQKDLAGHPWIADFFFTSCTMQCNRLSAAMAELQNHFVDKSDLQFVSITVDPENDTPEKLVAYAKEYKADLNRWHFLTGDMQKVDNILKEEFKLSGSQMERRHTDRFILLDGQGHIRGYYGGLNAEDIAKLKHDVGTLYLEIDSAT